MRISSALSSAVSGLAANAAAVQAVAENVANANTPGYRTVEVRTSSGVTGGSSPGGVQVSRVRQGEVNLARQFTRLIQAEISYTANAQVVRTADDLARKLIDVVA